MRLRFARGVLAGLAVCLAFAATSAAHVGSPDVYYEGTAGPYRLFVTVRTPQMIPGIAQIEAQALDGQVNAIRIVPMRLVGEGSDKAPPPDVMERSAGDAKFFSGKLWLMESGSFQVRMTIDGAQGPAEMRVPVAAFARQTLRMQRTTGVVLTVLMTLLAFSLIAIFGAATRESQVEPGQEVPARNRTRGRIAMAVAAVVAAAILFLGNMWWSSVAQANARDMIYKAPPMEVSLTGDQLTLKLGSSYWHELRSSEQLSKIIPDHGHLMHLFLLRMPEMDEFYHLHPEESAAGAFTERMPTVEGGTYAVFADIVRESGFPDTMMAKIRLPAGERGAPLTGDDSSAAAPQISTASPEATTALLGADEHAGLVLDGKNLQAQKPVLLRFRVTDKNGAPAKALQPYMGMAGHLVIVRRDLGVFAHIHPAGSVPMAALMLLSAPGSAGDGTMAGMDHGPVSNEITFPYGFPQAGEYRLFLQVKRAGRVETGVFDVRVLP
jgi:hypothetical protein